MATKQTSGNHLQSTHSFRSLQYKKIDRQIDRMKEDRGSPGHHSTPPPSYSHTPHPRIECSYRYCLDFGDTHRRGQLEVNTYGSRSMLLLWTLYSASLNTLFLRYNDSKVLVAAICPSFHDYNSVKVQSLLLPSLFLLSSFSTSFFLSFSISFFTPSFSLT